MSLLDGNQTLAHAFDDANQAFKVLSLGTFVPKTYDEIALTYIVSGNGAGQVGTVVYKLAGATLNTLTLTYDSSNNLVDVLKS